MPEFSLDIARQLASSNEQFPVSFDDAFEWLGYTRKDNAKNSFLKCGFIENIDYHLLRFKEVVNRPQGGGSQPESIYLTIDCFKLWAMLSKTTQGNNVRLYFLECEKQLKAINNVTQQVVSSDMFATFAQQIVDQLKTLHERTNQLDVVKEENQQLNNELTNTTQQLNLFHEAGETHSGCFNVLDSAVQNTKQRLMTAYEYLRDTNKNVELANVLSRRTATFYRCSLKKEPYKNNDNILVFEERYLEEAYNSLRQEI